MFCPVCESEYEAGVAHCPDDDAELVERLTPENTVRDHSEARFVTLHNVGSPAEAEMVNDILAQNGIRSAVQSGGMDAFSPLLSSTSPGAVVESNGENASEPPDCTTARMSFCCKMSATISASAGEPTLCNATNRASL